MTREILEPLSAEERIVWLYDVMQRTYAAQCENIDTVRNLVAVIKACLQTPYTPTAITPMPFFHFFRARDISPEEVQARVDFWSPFGATFHVMPGEHSTLLTDLPNAVALAQELMCCLQTAYEQDKRDRASA